MAGWSVDGLQYDLKRPSLIHHQTHDQTMLSLAAALHLKGLRLLLIRWWAWPACVDGLCPCPSPCLCPSADLHLLAEQSWGDSCCQEDDLSFWWHQVLLHLAALLGLDPDL